MGEEAQGRSLRKVTSGVDGLADNSHDRLRGSTG
jgi:hypothetical protein